MKHLNMVTSGDDRRLDKITETPKPNHLAKPIAAFCMCGDCDDEPNMVPDIKFPDTCGDIINLEGPGNVIKLQGTGGWLRSGGEEERYIMVWCSPNTRTFELPTGGSELMRTGRNSMSLARKEQCLAMGKQLKTTFKINDYKIFRLLPDGQITLLHPKDGVFPEKVNSDRLLVGAMEANIGRIKD